MLKDFIPQLQPLFCSRASLLKAQEAIAGTNLDCQLRIRIADGRDIPLNISRADIETIISDHIDKVEANIHMELDTIVDEETGTTDNNNQETTE